MRPPASLVHSLSLSGSRGRTSLFLLPLTLCAAFALHAQSPLTEAQQSPANTLHLYTRFVELPTLVLRLNNRIPPSVDPNAVNITLDAMRPFHPTSIRLEGDDPLSLAIVLDTREHPDLLPSFKAAFSSWLAESFKPQDRISLYALSCHLLHEAGDQPPTPAVLQPALDSLLVKAKADAAKSHTDCPRPVHSRDAIDFVMRQQAEIPGRRVLLVLATDGGQDTGNLEWSDLASHASLYALTVFNVNAFDPAYITPRSTLNQWVHNLDALSAHSGGTFTATTDRLLPSALAKFISLLRQRYILQFSMPPNLTRGIHEVYVTINKTNAIIRPSGITVPLGLPTTPTGPVNLPLDAPAPAPPDNAPQNR